MSMKTAHGAVPICRVLQEFQWQADVAKLVDARDLKSLDFGHTGSTPVVRTKDGAKARGAEFPPPSRKKQRGEFAPGADRRRIGRSPGVEKLQQLLARAIVVPGPVAFDDFNELGGRLFAAILGIEEDGEIESRLMVVRIGRDLAHELGSIADGGGLSGEGERRLGGYDRLVALPARGDRGENGAGTDEVAGGNEELRQSGHGGGVAGVCGDNRAIEVRRPLGV